MCGGGGKAPVYQDNSVEVERLKQEEAARNRAAEDARKAAEDVQRRSTFATKLSEAQTGARQSAQRRLTTQGLNYDEFAPLFEQAITRQSSVVPDLATNPGEYFSDSFIGNVLSQEEGDRRARFTREARAAFDPNAADTAFANTVDDPFINSILGRQKTEAVNALDIAKRRGSLSDTGYTGALTRLGEMERSGQSTAQRLGGTVLSDYRNRLKNIGAEANQAAGSYRLGDQFNLSPYQSRYSTSAAEMQSGLEGDINSALEGQNFFDIGSILTSGGNAQGPVNPQADYAALLAREDVRNQKRGVGGTGVF